MSSRPSEHAACTKPSHWDVEELVRSAKAVMVHASVPLSRFRVGAAVLTVDGVIFEGCNTESLIPVLGVCAERNAVNHALIHGHRGFIAVAVVSDLAAPLLPCGTCLQYLQEFAREEGRDILIIAEGRSGERMVTSVDEVFGGGFPPDTSVKDLQESFGWIADE
jgi:cytidine deaminase